MKVNYFGMSYREQSATKKREVLGPDFPLTFIRLEKPSNSRDGEQLLMIVKAETVRGLQILPPMYVAADKASITANKAEAVRLSQAWRYDRETNWPAIGRLAINLMAEYAKNNGVPTNRMEKWYE